MRRDMFFRVACLSLASALILSGAITTRVFAVEQSDISALDEQISALEAEIDNYRNIASDLAGQAQTLENQIALLQNEQETLKAQIELKQAEYNQLEIDIENTQSRISENSETIGLAIAQYYYTDKISTFERLASSENFSSFIDEEVHLVSIADTLSDIVEENKNLKAELEVKKNNAANMILDLGSQKEALAAKEKAQADLLEQTRNSEELYQNLRLASESQKQELRQQRQQMLAVLNASSRTVNGVSVSAGDPAKGGYPYSDVCPWQQDMYGDAWGMYVCECVSYAAWKVQQYYGYMPYWGAEYADAINWPNLARAYGYSVSYTPKANTVGISGNHAVWIEYVDGSNVYVSQYNSPNAANGYRWGDYSEQWFDSSVFVYLDFSH